MADIVSFPTQELGYWTCNCGCLTHRVRSDGEIECASCGTFASNIGYWRKPSPDEAPREARDGDAEAFDTLDVDPVFSRKRHAKRVVDGEFIIALGIRADGALSTCRKNGTVVTDEQRDWLRRCLDRAYELIVVNDKG